MLTNRSRIIGLSVAAAVGSSLVAILAPALVKSAAKLSPAGQTTSPAQGFRASRDEFTAVTSEATSASPPVSRSRVNTDESGCGLLAQDHPLRTKLNGRRLPLDYWNLEKGDECNLFAEAKIVPLSDGRLLCGLGDTLYMLSSKRRVEWKYVPSSLVMDFAVVESTGLVYGTAADNVMFILDASNGKRLYVNGRNGKFAYGQAAPFGKDMCLITDSLVGYREALEEWRYGQAEAVEIDGITAWRGTEALWSVAFPPDADLVVNGDRIYAVTRTDKSIYVREITPPRHR
jgi:hypothetical protein